MIFQNFFDVIIKRFHIFGIILTSHSNLPLKYTPRTFLYFLFYKTFVNNLLTEGHYTLIPVHKMSLLMEPMYTNIFNYTNSESKWHQNDFIPDEQLYENLLSLRNVSLCRGLSNTKMYLAEKMYILHTFHGKKLCVLKPDPLKDCLGNRGWVISIRRFI